MYMNYRSFIEGAKFSNDVKELGHARLGLSQASSSPAQVWQKMERAFRALYERGYFKWYEYDKEAKLVSGEVSESFMPKKLLPLLTAGGAATRRSLLVDRMAALKTQRQRAEKLLASIEEEDT